MTSGKISRDRTAVALLYVLSFAAALLALFVSRNAVESSLTSLAPGVAHGAVAPNGGAAVGASVGAAVSKNGGAAGVGIAAGRKDRVARARLNVRLALGLAHKGKHGRPTSHSGTKPNQPGTQGGGARPAAGGPGAGGTTGTVGAENDTSRSALTVRVGGVGQPLTVSAGDGGVATRREDGGNRGGPTAQVDVSDPVSGNASGATTDDDCDSGLGVSLAASLDPYESSVPPDRSWSPRADGLHGLGGGAAQ
jgi:hypothetical protein